MIRTPRKPNYPSVQLPNMQQLRLIPARLISLAVRLPPPAVGLPHVAPASAAVVAARPPALSLPNGWPDAASCLQAAAVDRLQLDLGSQTLCI